MNTEIIAEKSVSLSNGFQTGQWVKFLTQTPSGEWVEEELVGTGEGTWHDDTLIDDMKVSLEGKKGILGGFRGVSSLSYVKYSSGFFGFTAEELAAPTPATGYSSESVDFNAHEWAEVKTLADYLYARFVSGNFTPWSEIKDGVHEMPYEWGDQAAASFALVIGGKLVDSITGCGDGTPYLTESEEKCFADRKLHTSCSMEDERAEQEEAQEKFFAAAKRLGVPLEEKYRRLCPPGGWTEELEKEIEAEVVRFDSDQRADADKTGILRRLLNYYRKGQNPLPTLRTEKGGEWKFIREFPHHLYTEENEWKLPEGTVVFKGDNWWVVWER